MNDPSPLLHGRTVGTPLDNITNRLYFIFPLSKNAVEWLNTVIYKDDIFWINYWSLTHTLFGIFWGLLYKWNPFFNLQNLIIFHTIFEIWEFWAGGYFSGTREIILPEIIDTLMDTLFAIGGFYLTFLI